jgi:hypothetical protein
VNWIQRGHIHYSAPYQVMTGVRGYEVWIYSKQKSGMLGREIATLPAAKSLCEAHKSKEAA